MTDFSVSVFENKIGTRHRFLINKPQHPLRFINLICQNTIAQHHSESVSSAKNKRRQILCANKAAGYNSEPEKSSPVPEHISFFPAFSRHTTIRRCTSALCQKPASVSYQPILLLQNQFLSMSYLKILKGNKSISIQSIVSNLLPFHPLSSFLSIFVFTAA